LIVKNALAAALIVAALGAATSARAQVFGQFTTATTVPTNGHLLGGYINASPNVTGALAQLRLSFYPNVDFGFHGGLTRLDPGANAATLTTLRLGVDFRWQAVHASQGSKVDVAVGGALGIETADRFKVVSVGPSVVASRDLGIGSSSGIAPYAGLAMLFSSRDTFGRQTSDLSVPLRLGMEARLTQELRIVTELQFFITDQYGDDVSFSAGVNLPF
jgi:hypothetical protein